jgi:hypothetical protein
METRARKVKVDGVDAGEAEAIPPQGFSGQPGQDPLIEMIAQLMDSAFQIPGTRIRVGIDPLLGLIPGLGDYLSAMVSAVLVGLSSRYGVPKVVIARMVTNVLLNTIVGAVPIVGDLFSVWFKSNAMNYALLQKHAGPRRESTVGDWIFFALLIGGALIIPFLVIVGLFTLVNRMTGAS